MMSSNARSVSAGLIDWRKRRACVVERRAISLFLSEMLSKAPDLGTIHPRNFAWLSGVYRPETAQHPGVLPKMAGAKMEDIRPGQVSVVAGGGRLFGHPRGIQTLARLPTHLSLHGGVREHEG